MSLLSNLRKESTQPWQARLPFYYGWVIVWIISLRAFVTAGTMWVSLGVLAVPMNDELGWSRTVIFAGMSLRTVGAALAGLIFGRYLDIRGGPRALGLFSGVAAATCLIVTAFVQEQWQFLLVFGFIGGFLGTGPAALMMGAVVPKWFVRTRGRAVTLSTLGTGLAGFILAPVVTIISEAIGWRGAWATLGVLVFLIAALPAILLVTQPEDIGLEPDGGEAAQSGSAQRRRAPAAEFSFTVGEAMRTRTLWLLVAMAIFGGVTNSAYPANIVSAVVEKGFSPESGAAALSGYGLMSFSSRFFWGYISDRVPVRTALLLVACYTGCAVPLYLVLPGNTLLVAGALTGIGTGGWVALSQVVWAEYFGRANLGSIVGKTRPMITLVGATGPIYIAGLADLTGGYNVSMGVFAISWVLCALCLLFVTPPKAPQRAKAEAPAATAAGG